MYKAGHKCGDELDLVNGRPTGAIRVSFGYYNTFNDVDKLISMICTCFVKSKVRIPVRLINHIKNFDDKQNKCNEDRMKLLHNTHDEKYGKISRTKEMPPFESEIVLREMAIFPIKSCGAFKINSSWKIGLKGFEYDREWMIIKDNGVCLTQKQNTRMCLIRPKIDLKQKSLILHCKGNLCFVIKFNYTFKSNKTLVTTVLLATAGPNDKSYVGF